MGWIVVVSTVVAGLAVLVWRFSAGGRAADIDVGAVSEGWLSEQRGRKD